MAVSAASRISPCLWFDNQAEDAAKFYTGIFPNSKIGKISHYLDEGFEIHGRPAGSVMAVEFELDGVPFMGLNGGPMFKFSEAISFRIACRDQKEIDYYADKLCADGEMQCGWLKDKFGLSWQVVPVQLEDLLSDPDTKKSNRVMKAMLKMAKLDIAKLEEAYRG